MEAIVLAGGLGTRLSGVVRDRPKPMAPLHGRPFLEYLLRYWRQQGVTRVVLSVGYKSETIAKHFGQRFLDLEIAYALESQPLGTGGGLALAARQLESDPFLVLNGDTYFEMSLEALRAAHDTHHCDLTFSLAELPAHSRYGSVDTDSQGRILGFHPCAGGEGTIQINAGAYLMTRDLLEHSGPPPGRATSLESELLPRWLTEGKRIFGVVGKGLFVDIGIPEDYDAAKKLITG